VPTLDEGSILLEATRLPGTALSTSVDTDLRLERAVRRIPEVRTVVSRIGAPEIANDPMGSSRETSTSSSSPPRVAPGHDARPTWPRRSPEVAEAARPEIVFQVSQPIEMRMNELVAGIRSDVAVSLYGEDLRALRELGERAGPDPRPPPRRRGR
jgi:cobalt-zinc-cadmium resistance protein CzcA